MAILDAQLIAQRDGVRVVFVAAPNDRVLAAAVRSLYQASGRVLGDVLLVCNSSDSRHWQFIYPRQAAELRIGRARRPGGATKLRRYVARELKAARAAATSDPEETKRIDVLQQIFLDHLPTGVVSDLNEVLRVELTGPALVRRLEGIRARHRLNPPDAAESLSSNGEIMRIVCSDGLL